MKKGLKLFTVAFALMFALAIKVNAATNVGTESALKDCVAVDGSTCLLSSNITLTESLEVATTVTIDLNGYSITPATPFTGDSLIVVLHGGTLTVDDSKGTGKISSIVDANVFVGIKMTKAGGDDSKQAALFVNAGTIEGYSYGISGNGNPGRGNTVISIKGGTVNGVNATGIYHPQEGVVEIAGGTVSGKTGIEMRSGTLLVSGGKIVGNGVPLSVKPNGNGTTTVGAGIAIAQHTTENDILVAITGGTIQGYSALYESDPQQNGLSNIDLGIIGGTFEAINGGTKAVSSETLTDFIAGGTYNTEVEESYIADESETTKEDGKVVVKTAWDIVIEDTENGTVTAADTAFAGETVKLEIKAKDGYKVASIKVIEELYGKEVKVTDNSFTMPNSPVSVEVTFEEAKVEPNPNTLDNSITFIILGAISLVGASLAINKLRKNA